MSITLGEGVIEWQKNNLEYKRYVYPELNPGSIVLDIGSFEGEFSKKIKEKYGCEPMQYDCKTGNAAWIHDGIIKIGGRGNTQSAFEFDEIIEYPCVDLARVITELEAPVALMKINIEGGEYGLLTHLYAKDVLKKIENIQVQFHCVDQFDYKLLYRILAAQMGRTHKLDWRYPFCWESWSLKN